MLFLDKNILRYVQINTTSSYLAAFHPAFGRYWTIDGLYRTTRPVAPTWGGLMVSIYPQDLVDIDKTAEKIWWILTNPGNKFGGGRCKTYIRNQICRR